MSPLKWSLLALTTLLSSEFCSAHRAGIMSEPMGRDLPQFTRTVPSPPKVPDLVVWPDLAPPRPPMDLFAQDPYPADDGSPSSPIRGQSAAQGLEPIDGPGHPGQDPYLAEDGPSPSSAQLVAGPYPPKAQSPNLVAGPIMVPPTPLMDGSDPSPARRVPPRPPRAMTSGASESDVSANCSGGGCGVWGGGGPGCGGAGCGVAPPCVPPPKNPYYCQPAGCAGSPGFGCGAGGSGFTIYLDDHFVEAVSSSGDEGKP